MTATAARVRTDSPRRLSDGWAYDRLYPSCGTGPASVVKVYVHDATGRDVPPDTVLDAQAAA